ncbi:MAG: PKD domain-containing protein [Bacteroidota bacterium]|nr:PKD domain-containing protein [Bacteroidota bacterium]
MKTLFCILLISLSGICSAQCTFSLGSDVTYCQGQTINSTFSAPAGQASYAWSTGATTQNITATAAGVYTCTVTLLSANLVTNGNFSSGNTGFSSSYSVGAGGSWGPISNPGTYYITNNANSAHTNFPSFSDHAGSGNMMVCNGSDIAGTSVWCQSITVTPNTNYNFSAWAATCVSGTMTELADLQFSINGSLIGSQFSPSISPGVWTQFNATWNSGANTTANICIVNQNTTASGNDFALDDIFFQQVCTANDNVSIIVNPQPTVTVPTNTTVCNGATIPATAFTSTPVGATYTWTNSNTAIGLAANGVGDISSFTASNAGSIAISGVINVIPTLNGCVGNATSYTITINPTPVLTAVTSQTICVNNSTSTINFTSTPASASVNWTNTDATIGLAASGSGNIAPFVGQNSGATPVTGSVSVTPILNSCVGLPITFDIVVSPGPTLSPVTSQTVCEGNPTTAITYVTNPPGITTVNWTSSNTANGLAANGSGDIPSFTASNGTNASISSTITATPSIGTCIGNPETFTITVDPSPVLNAVTSQTICVSNNTSIINFTSNPSGAIVDWTNSDAAIGLAANGSGDILSFAGQNAGANPLTGTIIATPTLNTCVGQSISFDIIVSPGPTLSTLVNQTVCAGTASNQVTFATIPAGIATINWTNSDPSIGIGASGIGDIAPFITSNATSNSIDAVFSAIPSIGTCVGNPVTFTITVSPSPTVTPVTNTTVCNTNTINTSSFTGSVGATFSWTNSNTNIGLAANGNGNYTSFTVNNISTTPEIATITVTPGLNGCIGAPINYLITINPTPVPPLTSNVSPYCLNESAVPLIATPGTGGSLLWWGTNAAGGTSSVTATTPLTNTVGTTIYYVSQIINGCESPRAPITVTVSTLPSITDPSDIIVCSGANVPVQNFVSNPVGATINWANTNATIGLAANGTGNVPSFNSANSGSSAVTSIITVTPNIGTCFGTPITYSVTVNPIPIAIVNNVTACNNTTVANINWSSTPVGSVYTWTNTNSSIGVASSGTSSINSFTAINSNSVAVNATVNVTPTLNGCVGPPSSFTITVNPTPAAPNTSNNSYCKNDVASALSPSGAGYLWYTTSVGGIGTTSAPTPSTSLIGTNSYYVSQTVNGCEGSRSTVTITINNLPSATLATVSPKCPPLLTDLALSTTDNLVSYNWVLGDGSTFSGNDTVKNHTYSTSGNYNVSVTVTDNNNCENILTFPSAVVVFEVPEAQFSYGPQPTTLLDPIINFSNISIGTRPLAYQWNFGTEPGTYVTSENPSYTYETAGEYVVQLITTNGFGCRDTTYKTVVIENDIVIYVPNSFTPNGDGVNESFYAQGIGIDEKDFSMMIFNRWGEKIFQSQSLSEVWTGKVNDKPLVDNETFIWKIIYRSGTGDKLVKSGHVTLVK